MIPCWGYRAVELTLAASTFTSETDSRVRPS
jgi:hypothetical protein